MDVNEGAGKQGEKKTEIPCQAVHALSALRKGQGSLSQVQNLPPLFQEIGQRRKDTWRKKSQLVNSRIEGRKL
jgi:hypothetical protein